MISERTIANFDKLLEPIPGDNPAGEYLLNDIIYDEIDRARQADDTLERGVWTPIKIKVSDWDKVIELATEALTKKTKDLQLAAWLAEALIWLNGFAGLRDGLYLIHELLSKYWESVYPEIDDGDLGYRIGKLEWINLKLPIIIKQIPITNNESGKDFCLLDQEKALQTKNFKSQKPEAFKELTEEEKKLPEDLDKAVKVSTWDYYRDLSMELKVCLAEFNQLDEVVDEKFGDEAPGFTHIKESLEDWFDFVEGELKNKPKPEPIATSAPASHIGPPKEPQPDSATTDAPVEPDEYQESTGAVTTPKPQPVKEEEAKALEVKSESVAPALDSKKETVSESSSPDAGTTVEHQQSAEKEPMTVMKETPKAPDVGLQPLLTLAMNLRERKPHSAIPYLILRAVRWGEMRENASYHDVNKLAAPSVEVRKRLKQLFEERKWKELLKQSEMNMSEAQGRAWLDLQFYTYQAMAHLGSSFKQVKAAIQSELRAYLTDLADLPVIDLSDGTPAASPETRRWLKDEILTRSPDNASLSDEESSEQADESVDMLWTRAAAKVKAGQFPEGLAMLQSEVSKSQSKREKFLGKLLIAELCLSAEKPTLAKPILNELRDFIDRFRLEEWELKSLNVRFWRAFIRCYRKLDNISVEDRKQQDHAFEKLCQLDVKQALALSE